MTDSFMVRVRRFVQIRFAPHLYIARTATGDIDMADFGIVSVSDTPTLIAVTAEMGEPERSLARASVKGLISDRNNLLEENFTMKQRVAALEKEKQDSERDFTRRV